eukprot:287237-Amorphochlora_amoeboformis.AAC.1
MRALRPPLPTFSSAFLAALVALMTTYNSLTFLEISDTKIDYGGECLEVPIVGWISTAIHSSSGAAFLIIVLEWKVYNRLVDVEWRRIYWLSFIATLLLDVLGFILTPYGSPFSLSYFLVFGIDGKAINASKFRGALYFYCSLTVVVGYISASRFSYLCAEQNFVSRVVTSSRVSLTSYSVIKNLEYAYIKYLYPNVQVASNLDKMARAGFSICSTESTDNRPAPLHGAASHSPVDLKSPVLMVNSEVSHLASKPWASSPPT